MLSWPSNAKLRHGKTGSVHKAAQYVLLNSLGKAIHSVVSSISIMHRPGLVSLLVTGAHITLHNKSQQTVNGMQCVDLLRTNMIRI